MATGFQGAPARAYLESANKALTEARRVQDQAQIQAQAAQSHVQAAQTMPLVGTIVSDRSSRHPAADEIRRSAGSRLVLPTAQSTTTPRDEITANSGGHKTGVGTSKNIVADSGEYSTIFSRLNQIDDDMGRSLFRIASDIEDLCRGDFVVPRTVQRCNQICGSLKHALGEYRSLTEDTLVRTRRFVNGIMSIG